MRRRNLQVGPSSLRFDCAARPPSAGTIFDSSAGDTLLNADPARESEYDALGIFTADRSYKKRTHSGGDEVGWRGAWGLLSFGTLAATVLVAGGVDYFAGAVAGGDGVVFVAAGSSIGSSGGYG